MFALALQATIEAIRQFAVCLAESDNRVRFLNAILLCFWPATLLQVFVSVKSVTFGLITIAVSRKLTFFGFHDQIVELRLKKAAYFDYGLCDLKIA